MLQPSIEQILPSDDSSTINNLTSESIPNSEQAQESFIPNETVNAPIIEAPLQEGQQLAMQQTIQILEYVQGQENQNQPLDANFIYRVLASGDDNTGTIASVAASNITPTVGVPSESEIQQHIVNNTPIDQNPTVEPPLLQESVANLNVLPDVPSSSSTSQRSNESILKKRKIEEKNFFCFFCFFLFFYFLPRHELQHLKISI